MPVSITDYTPGQQGSFPRDAQSTVWALYTSQVTLYSGNSQVPDISSTVQAGQYIIVDGRIWKGFLVQSGQIAVYFGVQMSVNPTVPMGYVGPTGGPIYSGQTKRTFARLLEHLTYLQGGNYSLEVDESLAAGASGSDTAGFANVTIGTRFHIVWGMSQDALGTSPHASYMYVQGNTSSKVYWKARGAVNPYGAIDVFCQYG